jgi:hypothetical protein
MPEVAGSVDCGEHAHRQCRCLRASQRTCTPGYRPMTPSRVASSASYSSAVAMRTRSIGSRWMSGRNAERAAIRGVSGIRTSPASSIALVKKSSIGRGSSTRRRFASHATSRHETDATATTSEEPAIASRRVVGNSPASPCAHQSQAWVSRRITRRSPSPSRQELARPHRR